MVSRILWKSLWPAWALVIAPSCLSAGWFSGQYRLDAQLKQEITASEGQTAPEPRDDRLELGRLRFAYNQFFHDNRYYAKVALVGAESDVFQIKNHIDAETDLASQTFDIGEVSLAVKHRGVVTTYGRIETPALSDEHELFQLGIGERVGTILGRSGYRLGAMAAFQQRALGTQIGVWEQTLVQTPTLAPEQDLQPTSTLDDLSAQIAGSITAESYEKQGIRYSWGGRVAYTPYYSPQRCLGIGVGFRAAPLDQPLVLAVLYDKTLPSDSLSEPIVPAQGFSRALTFKRLEEIRFDLLRTYDNMMVRAAGSYQKLPLDQSSSLTTNDDGGGAPTISVTPEQYIFEDTGRSFAYYVEGAYLFNGGSYHVCRERAALQGVRVPSVYGALEIGLRWGFERYTNALSLMQLTGAQDLMASSYDDGAVSGQGRLQYSNQGSGDQSYMLMTVNNSLGTTTNDGAFITPVTQKEYSFFGLGKEKDVTYSYKTYVKGLSLHMNYYFNESTALQAQFESQHYEKNVISRDNGLVESPQYQHVTQWRVRLESCF